SGQFIPIRTIDPNSTYITIQCNEFIRFFKNKGISQLPVVIDMECFAKQMLQEGTDLDNNPKWSVLRFLRNYSQIDSDFKLKPSTSSEFAKRLYNVYKSLLDNKVEEKERFEKIEIPTNSILYNRQLKGIKINRELAEKRC